MTLDARAGGRREGEGGRGRREEGGRQTMRIEESVEEREEREEEEEEETKG